MDMTGLLHYILPEIEALKGVAQNPEHHKEGDAYIHTLMVLKNAKKGELNQCSALLHDVGKAKVTTEKDGKLISYGHDDVGAKMAEDILKRLRFSSVKDIEPNLINKVVMLVKNHMRPHELCREDVTEKGLRKFIREMGSMEMVDACLDLSEADEKGKIPPTNQIEKLRQRIHSVGSNEKRKPILNGKEVMDLLGLKTGTEVGRAVDILNDIQDEFGIELTKEKASEELLKRF